jgi:hypothetical protein
MKKKDQKFVTEKNSNSILKLIQENKKKIQLEKYKKLDFAEDLIENLEFKEYFIIMYSNTEGGGKYFIIIKVTENNLTAKELINEIIEKHDYGDHYEILEDYNELEIKTIINFHKLFSEDLVDIYDFNIIKNDEEIDLEKIKKFHEILIGNNNKMLNKEDSSEEDVNEEDALMDFFDTLTDDSLFKNSNGVDDSKQKIDKNKSLLNVSGSGSEPESEYNFN